MTRRIETGARIDGFVVGACVHDGGMGLIFRVEGPDTGFPLMMKVPRLGQGQPTEGIVGFEMETMLLRAIRSAHAPRFVAAGDLTETPYLVTEWIEGDNLEQVVRSAPIAPDRVARIGAALADAAASLHRQGVIHLDIKPGNVLLRADGTAVLIDYGLSHHERLPDLLAEEMRKAVGTAEYISPEQVLGVRNDPRSDVFAIGVVLYELATGELPFGAPESVSGLRDRLWLDPKPPRAIVATIPEWLQEVILRCIDARPEQRYPTAEQLAFALRHPDRVDVTERGRKLKRLGVMAHLKRWVGAAGREAEVVAPTATQLDEAPIIVAAVDTVHLDDALQKSLQAAVLRVVRHASGARLAAITVVRDAPLMDAAGVDKTSSGLHLDHLVRLRHWAAPMQLPPERLTVHAFEGSNPAQVVLEFARANHASLIVIGAAHYSEPRLGLGRSITTTVAEEAPCSVYIVRASAAVLGTPASDDGAHAAMQAGGGASPQA